MGSDQVNDEGGALMNEINALIKENPEGFLIPPATEDTAGRQQFRNQQQTLTDTNQASTMIFKFPAPGQCEINVYCL